MTVGAEDIVVRYPEFGPAGDELIERILAESYTQISGEYGTKRDLAVQLLTAHTLAQSPFARSLNLVQSDGSTTFSVALDKIKRAVLPRMIVV